MTGPAGDGVTRLLSHRYDNHFQVEQWEGPRRRVVAEGERAEGWIALEDHLYGMMAAFRHMAEEYPNGLGVDGAGCGLNIYLWRDPDGGRLAFRRYDEVVYWDRGEGVYADGVGAAKTNEVVLHVYRTADGSPRDVALSLLHPPHVAVDSTLSRQCQVTGGFLPRDEARFPRTEAMLTEYIDWLDHHQRIGRWYGWLDYGDIKVHWDRATGTWILKGRHGWTNSEWDPRHGVWVAYLRSGDPRLFEMAEALTRHSIDVDTCHYHPFRPYAVGGSHRHNVSHWGDETCPSHTFIDNWVDYYLLTGDGRTLDVLREAGDFFLNFRWTDDPVYSFSLRGAANAFRGLIYLYELTGERRYLSRAEELFTVFARAQNEDGSWHKRFQVSTPDRLPNQGPWGMACEGTTLAVEMGTTPPFTDMDLLEGGFGERRVLPLDQQKGYQTHYLMVGLEEFHRLTERSDVTDVYLRAVNWFCGNTDPHDMAVVQREHYGGILCCHLAYAWRLTGDRRYLETGRALLDWLIDQHRPNDDVAYHGPAQVNGMTISLIFWGVPYLMEALDETGLGDGL
jgi:hypothetical protein